MTESGLDVRKTLPAMWIGVLKGEDSQLPCVMMGPHYDSVYNGGDYDGIAGVICAIEVARLLLEEAESDLREISWWLDSVTKRERGLNRLFWLRSHPWSQGCGLHEKIP